MGRTGPAQGFPLSRVWGVAVVVRECGPGTRGGCRMADGAVLLHVPRFCSSIVVAAAAEAGLPLTVRVVGYPEELRSAELASATGGLAKVPCLLESSADLPLLESSAILEYLLEAHGSTLRVAPGDPARAKYLALLAFSTATVKPLVSNEIFLAGLAAEPDAAAIAAIAAATEEFTERVGPFLARQLGDQDWFVGGRLTACDLALAKPLGNALATEGLLDAFPTLRAHYERVSARPCPPPRSACLHVQSYPPKLRRVVERTGWQGRRMLWRMAPVNLVTTRSPARGKAKRRFYQATLFSSLFS